MSPVLARQIHTLGLSFLTSDLYNYNDILSSYVLYAMVTFFTMLYENMAKTDTVEDIKYHYYMSLLLVTLKVFDTKRMGFE